MYQCPMHPEVVSKKSGKCPKCGGMDLVETDDSGKGMEGHDHSQMMAGPKAAKDFLRRFLIVTFLLFPLFLFSAPASQLIGFSDFSLRPYLEFAAATAIFYFGLVFFEHAKMEIRMRQYGMMTLVSLGVGAGYLFSAVSTFVPKLGGQFYLEVSTLIWVLLFGHFLEAKSSAAAGDALQEVAKLLPKEAHRKTADGVRDVEIGLLKEGDTVLVKPGEKVPADGIIAGGAGNFNESHLTGESKPVGKKVGSPVAAGAISLDGAVEVKLSKVGDSSTVGQIRRLIASARKTKPSAQKLADRAAGWLTFSALSVSIFAFLFWLILASQTPVFAATLAITVLVIACPHALGLAIPTVSTIATRLAVENGIFIKDLAKIEAARKANYVVFDKTGTLTKGKFGVSAVTAFAAGESEVLKIAAAIESRSSHVIGRAIVDYAKEKKIAIPDLDSVRNLPGRGMEAELNGENYFVGSPRLSKERGVLTEPVSGILEELSKEGKTAVLVGSSSAVLGVIALSDEVREESARAVAKLHRLGIKVAMLTGDTKEAAEPVAQNLAIDTVFAGVLPEDKYKYIKELQEQGNVVLMAGDGVNDAPALTQADVGVAIGAGTDVAVEAGDVVLTQSNPEHLVRLIILSRKVYGKMMENLFWAAGYNIVAIPAAAGLFIPFGFRLTPAVGALLMSLSSVIVVLNALSLRKTRL